MGPGLGALRGAPVVVLVLSSACRLPDVHCDALETLETLAHDPASGAQLVWIDPQGASAVRTRIAADWGDAVVSAGIADVPDGGLPGVGRAWRIDPERAFGGWPVWIVLDADRIVTYVGSGDVAEQELRAAIGDG